MIRLVQKSFWSIDALARRWEGHPKFDKGLPWIGLGIGVAWVLGLGLTRGIFEGGDTPTFLLWADHIRKEGLSARSLAGDSPGIMINHMTHFWIYLLGQRGFVILNAVLTAFLPLCVVRILRHAGVRPFFAACALLYVATNEEIYKWAFYILSDGSLIALVAIVVALITAPRFKGPVWFIIPVFWYCMFYSRAGGFLILPGVFVYGLWGRQPGKRVYLVALVALTIVFHAGYSAWLNQARRVDSAKEVQFFRDVFYLDKTRLDFINGHILIDPQMSPKLKVPFTPEEAKGRSLWELCRSYKAYCAHQAIRRFMAYIFPVYPLYSLKHKVFNALFYGGSILLSGSGAVLLLMAIRRYGWNRVLRRDVNKSGAALLCGTLILTVSVFHPIAAVDSDARYLMPWVTPWICFNFILMDLLTGVFANRVDSVRIEDG